MTADQCKVSQPVMVIDHSHGAFWHQGCPSSRTGTMKVMSHEVTGSTVQCLHCGAAGSYPVGGVGAVTVALLEQSVQP